MPAHSASPPADDPRPTRRPLARRTWAALFLVFGSVSAALVYPPMTKYPLYEPGLGGREGDVGQYVRMYHGEPLSEVPRPFRYRVLTPFLARVIPEPPQRLLRYFDMSDDKRIQYRFGTVNAIALLASGLLFVAYGRALGLGTGQALLCAFLFYTSFPVVNYGGSVMVEAWTWAFLLLGFLAAIRRSVGLLILTALVGPLAKEVTFLVLPAVLLLAGRVRSKLVQVAAILPGVAVYAWLRFGLYPGGYSFNRDPATALAGLAERLSAGPFYAWILFDGGMAFGVVLAFAALGLWTLRGTPRAPLVRLGWLVPAVFLMPFAIGSNIGRIWFYAFPVVIPLAVVGLGRMWDGGKDGEPPASLTGR